MVVQVFIPLQQLFTQATKRDQELYETSIHQLKLHALLLMMSTMVVDDVWADTACYDKWCGLWQELSIVLEQIHLEKEPGNLHNSNGNH